MFSTLTKDDEMRGESMIEVPLHQPHTSQSMYNNIASDMQHISIQPHFILQGAISQNTIPQPQQRQMIQSKDRPFECEICFRRFNQKQTLKQHILTHTGQRPFECNVCFKTFTQQGALQRHIVIHTGEKPFQCTYCDLNFRQKMNLLRHMKLHTGAPKEFQCRVCDREFSRKGALLNHEPIHDSKRPRLKCSCCNKDFLNRERLLRHMKSQELREKGIKCPKKIEKIIINCKHCGKIFRRTKSVLSITSDVMATSCLSCSSYGGEANPSGIHREVEIFQCELCQSTFRKSVSYEKHKRLHSNDRKYECAICHLRFEEKRFIRSHMITHISDCDYQCHRCGLKFKHASRLRAHYVSHADELKDDLATYVRVFNCAHCERCFYGRNQIIRHFKTHDKNPLNRDGLLTSHRNEAMPLVNNRAAAPLTNAKEAVSEVKTDGPDSFDHYDDSICDDNVFNNDSDDNVKSDMVRSVSIACEPLKDYKDYPFFCYICKRPYNKKRSLNRHFQVKHIASEMLACDVCPKTFKTKNSLTKHSLLHRPHSFQCDQCDKTFNRKDALASHKLIHSDKKSFACPHCPKTFFQKQSLHIHLSQHKGKKNFECGICNKSFYEKSTLNRHYLSHSGERKYSCHICNMSFIQKNHLDKHFVRHDEIEKKVTFECADCDKCYYRKDQFLRHRQSHDKNRTLFSCQLCNTKFAEKYSLTRHVKANTCVRKEEKRARKKKK